MKLKHLFLGMLTVSMFSACNDDVTGDTGKVLENETKTFVKISLVNTDGGTRAFDESILDKDKYYENGTADENKVNEVLLVFYDQARNYVGESKITVTEDKPEDDLLGSNDPTVSRILTSVAEVNLPENTNHPAYVMAYVNPTTAAGDLNKLDKLEDVMQIIRDENTVSKNGMTMNNSVYFDETLGNTRFATPVDFTEYFFKTEAEAKANPGLDITVERVQAKVRLEDFNKIEADDFKSDETTTPEYTLTFVPENWFTNATEDRTFLIKNFRSSNDNVLTGNYNKTDMGLTFSAMKTRFTANPSDKRENFWNDQTRKRCYWAIDPTYFNDETLYPAISYDVKGETVNPGGTDYTLTYRSYNQGVAGSVKPYEYCLENTMNAATLKSGRALASMTSVVLLGHYVIKKGDDVVFDGSSNKGTFYIRHNNDKNKTILVSDIDAKKYFLEHTGSLIYVQMPVLNEDGTKTGNYEFQPLRAAHAEADNTIYDDFELVYPKNEVLGQAVVSEQWRTMNFKEGAKFERYFVFEKDGDSYTYKPLDKTKAAGYLKAMYSAYGIVESFKEGKAYFNVPLKHIFNTSGNNNTLDAEKVVLGDYGVVRNHVYSLKINSIKGLGTGIGDLNQPIVPPTTVDKYYISARINILKWRLVNQSVDL